jgi:hypothetical protein
LSRATHATGFLAGKNTEENARSGTAAQKAEAEKPQSLEVQPQERRNIMSDVLKRDATGKCDEGECRDRVSEGNKDRKAEIEKEDVKTPENYPGVPDADKLINPDNPVE